MITQYIRYLLLITMAFIPINSLLAKGKTENVILITLDGMRWQEIFQGVDKRYFDQMDYIVYEKTHDQFKEKYWHETAEERRKILFPFLWNVIAKEGQIYGNREKGSNVNIVNKIHYSYPGYSEILTGVADPTIVNNDKILNPTWTFLQWMEEKQDYKGKTAAFASWDVFPYIFNVDNNDLFTNFGFEKMDILLDNENIQIANEIQDDIPVPWDAVRFDIFTFTYAFEYLKEKRPKALFISFGETDDYAHDGQYDRYINSAQKTDEFISRIWNWVQNDPEYKDKTTLLITTDHGRGYVTLEDWKSHGFMWDFTDEKTDQAIWMAVIGPDTPAGGEMQNVADIKQNQVAATLMKLIGLEYQSSNEALDAGKAIDMMIE